LGIDYLEESVNAREFLRSKGFAVGDRGRFSAEMKKCLADNGFDAAPAPKAERSSVAEKIRKTRTDSNVPDVPAPRPEVQQWTAKPEVVKPITRQETSAWAYDDKVIIAFTECGKCMSRINRCACDAPSAPKYFDRLLDNIRVSMTRPVLKPKDVFNV
jgi:hypothetical protein